MGKHLTAADVTAIEALARKKGATPNSVMEEVEKAQRKKRLPAFSESAVRRVLRGEAYQRAKVERRGRPRKATKRVIKAFEKSRGKISKKAKAKGQRVTYKMIMSDAKLKGKVSVRRLQPTLKETEGVQYMKDRERPERTKDEIEARLSKAGTWRGYSDEHWQGSTEDPQEGIHGYIDNKTFAVPTSGAKKAHLLKLKISGHLRKKSEGNNPEFLRPKKQHRGIGCPSITITACVGPSTGREVMWLPQKAWNGATAKAMYETHLKKALERTHGKLDFYRLVEDGDPSGYQSNLGQEGKRTAKIRSWQLPPRTPEWNPLDYAIWDKIEMKALKAAGKKETKATYGEKLKKAAKGLGVEYVKKVVGAMKKRIAGTYEAQGHHVKFD